MNEGKKYDEEKKDKEGKKKLTCFIMKLFVKLAVLVKPSYYLISLANQSSIGSIIQIVNELKVLVKVEKGNHLSEYFSNKNKTHVLQLIV